MLAVEKLRPADAPTWWPDWSYSAAAIIASGPSAKHHDLRVLDGRARVLAIKENVDLYPKADVVYGCDAPWWKHRRGLPEYNGLKLCYAGELGGITSSFNAGIKTIDIVRPGKGEPPCASDLMQFGRAGLVGSGGNSGFQALNLVPQFGSRRIILIGFDCDDRSGVHWYGRNSWSMSRNPSISNFQRWAKALTFAAPELEARGIEVVNVSELSVLKCFRKARTIDDALSQWGL